MTDPAAPDARATYTVAEIADLLGLSLGGTYNLVRTGRIPALRMGGRWLIPRRRFHTWLDTQTTTSAPPSPAGQEVAHG
jgi:excisionase family DNA binding protein